MRMEKSFGTWAREFRPIYGPYEAGLGRFVDLKKGDFIGRQRGAGGEGERRRPAAGRVRGRCGRCGCLGDEPIWHEGKVVGWVTSGALRAQRATVAGARLHSGGSWPTPRAALRSRSSASAARPSGCRAPRSIPAGYACAPEGRSTGAMQRGALGVRTTSVRGQLVVPGLLLCIDCDPDEAEPEDSQREEAAERTYDDRRPVELTTIDTDDIASRR